MPVFAKKQYKKVDEENPYWISFSDIMAGLLVIFILISLQFIFHFTQLDQKIDEREKEINRRTAAIEQAEKIRSALLANIQNSLKAQNIEVSVNENVLTIPSETLTFATNSAQIPSGKKDIVEKIGIQLIQHLNTPVTISSQDPNTAPSKYYIDTIFVEGHTDSRSSTYKEGGNWLLSTDRAVSVWRHWDKSETTKTLQQFKNEQDEKMFSVSGYGESRPVVEKADTPDLLEQNRRIDLRFTIREPKKCEYEESEGLTPC